jgi:hypothetical protein
MAIVMAIIGVVLAGILFGREMVLLARIRGQIEQIQTCVAADKRTDR